MDENNLKEKMKNTIFSNKNFLAKNKTNKQNNSNKNTNNYLSDIINNKMSSSNEYSSILLWVLLFIILIIISYLTVMTAKYLSTKCPRKRPWFNYIFRFSYMDICIPPQVPPPSVVNNIHIQKPGTVPPPMPQIPQIPQIPQTPQMSQSPQIPQMPPIPTTSLPEVKKKEKTFSLGKKEVFHIANQDYTYEQAKCKCKSYNSELATYTQLVDAYNAGAEWCTYGWSSGQKAYYPTQKCNWEKKSPEEKLKCGNPGLNGGFFADPYLKFGVNCYGKKPKGKVSQLNVPVCPSPSYCALPQNFGASNRLESDEISPFNSQKWNN
jgi:hypothetical protein